MAEKKSIISKAWDGIKALGRSALKNSPWLIAGGVALWLPATNFIADAIGSVGASLVNSGWISHGFFNSASNFFFNNVVGYGTIFMGVPVATGAVALTAAGVCAAYFAYKALKNTPREYEKVKQASAQHAATRQEEEQSQQQEKKRGWLSPITAVLGMGAALLGWKALTKSKTTQTPASAQKTVASVQTLPTPAPTADTDVVEPTHESPYLVSTDGKPVRGGKRKPPRTITPKDHSNTLSA